MPAARDIMEMMASSIPNARDEQRSAINGAPFLPPHMRWGRKRFWETLGRSWFRMENFWAPGLTFVHDARILELLDKSFFSSDDKKSE
jgi:hypothetical protein